MMLAGSIVADDRTVLAFDMETIVHEFQDFVELDSQSSRILYALLIQTSFVIVI